MGSIDLKPGPLLTNQLGERCLKNKPYLHRVNVATIFKCLINVFRMLRCHRIPVLEWTKTDGKYARMFEIYAVPHKDRDILCGRPQILFYHVNVTLFWQCSCLECMGLEKNNSCYQWERKESVMPLPWQCFHCGLSSFRSFSICEAFLWGSVFLISRIWHLWRHACTMLPLCCGCLSNQVYICCTPNVYMLHWDILIRGRFCYWTWTVFLKSKYSIISPHIKCTLPVHIHIHEQNKTKNPRKAPVKIVQVFPFTWSWKLRMK